jgi:hypothetical protein
VIAGNLPPTWAVHEKTPFHLTDFAGALGAPATLGLGAGPYWVAGGTAHADSSKANRSNEKPMRTKTTMHLQKEKAALAGLKPVSNRTVAACGKQDEVQLLTYLK